MILLKIAFLLTEIILIWHLATVDFLNEFKCIYIFGKKGSGKTTLLCKNARKDIEKGWSVYSTEDFVYTKRNKKTHKMETFETIHIDPESVPYYSFPPYSSIYVDEASLIWSNRDTFSGTNKESLKAMAELCQLLRRKKLKMTLASVTFSGTDKKIRDCMDELFICRCIRTVTFAKRLTLRPIVVHPTSDAPATITDDIITDPAVLYPFGGLKITFIPKWIKCYKSYLVDSND